MARFSSNTAISSSDIGSDDIFPLTHIQDNTDYKITKANLATAVHNDISGLASLSDISSSDTVNVTHNGVTYTGTLGDLLKTAVSELNATTGNITTVNATTVNGTTVKQNSNAVLDTSNVLSALDTSSSNPVNSTAVNSALAEYPIYKHSGQNYTFNANTEGGFYIGLCSGINYDFNNGSVYIMYVSNTQVSIMATLVTNGTTISTSGLTATTNGYSMTFIKIGFIY